MNLAVKIFIAPWLKIFGIKLFGLEEMSEMYSGIGGQLFLDF